MKLTKTSKALLAASLIAISSLVTGCEFEESSTQAEQRQQEMLSKEANSQVGMPEITRFFEKRQLKKILKSRDNPSYLTYTYVMVPGTGKRRLVCPGSGRSIGFGIPYSTQYTAPQKVITRLGDNVVIPQPDPNGLYMPESSEATFVMCVNPKGGDPFPVMVEDRTQASPVPLEE